MKKLKKSNAKIVVRRVRIEKSKDRKPLKKRKSLKRKSLSGFEPKIYTTDKKKKTYISKKGNYVPLIYPVHIGERSHRLLVVKELEVSSLGYKIKGKNFDSKNYETLDRLFKAIDWELVEEVFAKHDKR